MFCFNTVVSYNKEVNNYEKKEANSS